MVRLLANWLLSAIALLIVSRLVPGFQVESFGTALIAALIFGLLNVTLGLILKLVTLPLTILTLGLFLLVINAFLLELASEVSAQPSGAQPYWPSYRCSSAFS